MLTYSSDFGAARLDPCELRTIVPYTYTLSGRSAELHAPKNLFCSDYCFVFESLSFQMPLQLLETHRNHEGQVRENMEKSQAFRSQHLELQPQLIACLQRVDMQHADLESVLPLRTLIQRTEYE
ncbi:hypothetical protein EVAR_101202_1 [Eumeta japonica]|uniref:Uncharacterized protein n=1 Tax=Eumeta variegata TaxID=151549 RepID=A0A4C2AA36_EUMVA|nr:hypothetical protein EVAR_101202_1 [Eumeta japonica]